MQVPLVATKISYKKRLAMSRHEKAIKRLVSKPVDFTWSELMAIMTGFGYSMRKTGGSGRKFLRSDAGNSFVIHEPHPRNELKAYQVREFLAFLKQEGDIE